MFHMFFLVKYCKMLEEGSFRGRSADFLWMLLFGVQACSSIIDVHGPRAKGFTEFGMKPASLQGQLY